MNVDWNDKEEDNMGKKNKYETKNQSISPDLTFHSTKLFTKKREMLDSVDRTKQSSKTKDIDDDYSASDTFRSKDDDEDDSITSDVSLADSNECANENPPSLSRRASWFKERWNKRSRQNSLTSDGSQNMIDKSNCNGDKEEKNNSEKSLDFSQTPKSVPNSPMKKAYKKQILQRSQSTEQTNNIGLNTREGSAYSRIRRVRSKHSRSLERVWLPGRVESFNSRVSNRRLRKEETEGPSNSQYYFLSPSKMSKCHQIKV